MKTRMDSAITLILSSTGKTPQVVLWYTQGINDAIAGTNVNTWKANSIAFITKYRLRYGLNVPVIMTLLPQTYSTFNTKIYEIAAEVANIQTINTPDNLLQVDGNHWNYQGQKDNGNNLTLKTIPSLNITVNSKATII